MSTSYACMHPNDVISLIMILASVYISIGLIIFIWLHLMFHSFKLGPNLFYTSKERFYVVNPAHFSVYYPFLLSPSLSRQAPPSSATPTDSRDPSPVPQAEAPPPKPTPVVTGPFSVDLSKYHLPPLPRLTTPISVPRLSEVIGPDVSMPVLESR